MQQREPIRLDFSALSPLPAPAWLDERARAIGVELEPHDIRKLGLFLAALMLANEQMNLTSVREPDKAWERHVLDSLTLMGVLSDLPDGARVIDVGTGGGLPGVPLAICMPHLRFTLLDSTAKKVAYLERLVHALELTNAAALLGRAEILAHDLGTREDKGGLATRVGAHREAYDAVIARAVSAMPELAELTIPLAKVGGVVAFIKGEKAQQELDAAGPILHELKAVAAGIVPTPTGQIVVLEKRVATPRVYPRAHRG